MLPLLRDGDVAFVEPAVGTQVSVGDVICYEKPPGRLFVHRVIDRAGDRIRAKGDALESADVIDAPQVLGKVVAITRSGRMKRLDTQVARWRDRSVAFVSRRIPRLLPLAIHVARGVRACLRG